MPSLHPALASLVLAALLSANPPQKPWTPIVEPASEEGQQAIARFKLPKEFTASLWAAEPRCANIVSFTIDHGGDVYVAETFRMHDGTIDLRDYMDWLDDDLASKTVADRVAMIRKHDADNFADYTRASERVRWLRDQDGDGAADLDTVFADDFRDPATGLGAGLLAWQGRVFYTCMPDLWLLEDKDHDGKLDGRRVLSHGYGVHTAMIGHDLHGLRVGPDGRLYFSCGDRAFSVKTERGTIEHTHCGAVLRCNLDGTGLEVFATGLRNPQELVFDDFGNLFTGDNNSDGGDKARWVHVLEGSDSGYRYGYQWQEDPHQRGPWNEEKLWHPHFAGQAAYITPPVAWLGEGPAGITWYPGTGLTEEYRGRFFTANFTGGSSSAIFSFPVKPKGASFELGTVETFLSGSLVTDVEFGPDGALWWSDWVQGWRKTGKGRIYRVTHPTTATRPEVVRTRTLLKEGVTARSVDELGTLLAEPDQRVRLMAHLELAARGAAGVKVLGATATATTAPQLARLHAIWGLGAAARAGNTVEPGTALGLLADGDPEVRCHAAALCADLGVASAVTPLIAALRHESPRLRLYAAMALGRLGDQAAVEPLLALARELGETDPHLRHGVTWALSRCAKPELLARLVTGEQNPDARIAGIVALRRHRSAEVAAFFADADPRVAIEAARAGYDLYLTETLPRLAARIHEQSPKPLEPPALARRVLAACLRVGGEERAKDLARFAREKANSTALRVEALEHLRRFADTPGRDPITGEWQPFPRTDEEKRAAGGFMPGLVLESSPLVQAAEPLASAWLELVRTWKVKDTAATVDQLAFDDKRPAKLRAQAFRVLTALAPPNLLEAARRVLAGADVELRVAALEAVRKHLPAETFAVAETALAAGSAQELRFAYDTLGKLGTAPADALLARELQRSQARLVPAEVQLDLVLAAEARRSKELDPLLPARAASQPVDPLLSPWLDGLFGGDAGRGRKIFRSNKKLACQRCHKADDDDTGQVGPSLRGLGQRATRLAILESIVDPNRKVTAGYQGMILELVDGTAVAGRIEREEQGTVFLRKADDSLDRIPAQNVKRRRTDLSSMPEGLAEGLTRPQMRDLIEFLATLK